MSVAGSSRHQHGLTLVEMLVVLGVIALVGGVVITTLPKGTPDAERAARGFAREVVALSDLAITSGAPSGLSASEDGTLRLHAYANGWTERGPLPLPGGIRTDLVPAGDILAPDPEPTGTLIVYRPPGQDAEPPAPAPPVTFSATGEVTPFTARFQGEGQEAWLVTVGPFAETAVTRAQ